MRSESIYFYCLLKTTKNNMRIAHLVLYTEENAHEQAMQQMQRTLYDNLKDVQTVYYTYSYHVRTITYDPTERILRIPGHESFIPGILRKTWTAFEWAQEHMFPFDVLVRSNTSTLINFPLLLATLKERPEPIQYGGMHVFTLSWLCPRSGVHDATYHGTQFASGFCILWNAATFARMMRDGQAHLDYTLIDDVAIGVMMQRMRIASTSLALTSAGTPQLYIYNVGGHHPTHIWPAAALHSLDMKSEYQEQELAAQGSTALAFRHHTFANRTLDAKLMAMTLRYLLRWAIN